RDCPPQHELFQQPGGTCRANPGGVYLRSDWLICREFLGGWCYSRCRHHLLSGLAWENRADSKARNRSRGGTGCEYKLNDAWCSLGAHQTLDNCWPLPAVVGTVRWCKKQNRK